MALPFALASCTSVNVQGAGVSSTSFGALKITPTPGAKAVIVSMAGYGVVPSTQGTTIGFGKELTAYIYDKDDCRAIFFIENQAQAESIVALFKAEKLDKEPFCEIRGAKQ